MINNDAFLWVFETRRMSFGCCFGEIVLFFFLFVRTSAVPVVRRYLVCIFAKLIASESVLYSFLLIIN